MTFRPGDILVVPDHARRVIHDHNGTRWPINTIFCVVNEILNVDNDTIVTVITPTGVCNYYQYGLEQATTLLKDTDV